MAQVRDTGNEPENGAVKNVIRMPNSGKTTNPDIEDSTE